MTTVIIGGGIGGLASAAALSTRRNDVVLLERESELFAHSSGRNAAIFRPLEVERTLVALAARSRVLLQGLAANSMGGEGLCLVAHEQTSLTELLRSAQAMNVRHELWNHSELAARAPWLQGGRARWGIHVPDAGSLDLDAIRRALRHLAAEHRVEIRNVSQVAAITRSSQRVTGVRLEDGTQLHAQEVVIAGGAWAEQLGQTCACPLPLPPYRRHLVQLKPADSPPVDEAEHPICWDVETGMYFRVNGEGLLACPGDHALSLPGIPDVDLREVARLEAALPEHAPRLVNTPVVRSHACLRTRSPDGLAVVGADPRLDGLFWMAGLGGHGMSVGLACAELLAMSMTGDAHPEQEALDPARLLPI